MRLTALLIATACATSPQVALACNPPVLSVNNGTLTYSIPSTDVYGNGNIAAFVDNFQPGKTLLIDAVNRNTFMIDLSENSLSEIQVSMGAETIVFDGPNECHPRELRQQEDLFPGPEASPAPTSDRETLPDKSGPAPIELFPDDPGFGLQPRSGLWKAHAGTPVMSGCPALMQTYASRLAEPVPAEDLQPRRLDVVRPFHPNQLAMTHEMQAGFNTRIDWKPLGQQSWQAEVFSDLFAQIPSGEGAGSKMVWTLTVLSETDIEHHVTIQIALPDVAAQMMGSGNGDCRVALTNLWRRVGD